MSNASKMIFYVALIFSVGTFVPAGWAHEHEKYSKQGSEKEDQKCCLMHGSQQKPVCGYKDKEGGTEKKACPKIMFFKKMSMILGNEESLGLSEEQVFTLKDLKLKTQKNFIMKEAEIEANDLDIDAQMWEEKWDADILNGLIDKKFELTKEEAKILVSAFVTLKGTLTQEQTRILKELCGDSNKSKKDRPFSKAVAPTTEKTQEIRDDRSMQNDSEKNVQQEPVPFSSTKKMDAAPLINIPSPIQVDEEKTEVKDLPEYNMENKSEFNLNEKMDNMNATQN